MSDWLDRVHFGDCRKVMQAWPAGVADACITDPPYGDTSLEWDRRVDGWMVEVARVLKPAASVWVFGSMRYLSTVFAEMEAQGFRYAQDIVWEKQNGTGFHNDRFRRVHEHAVQFYRGAWGDVFKDPQYTMDARPKRVVRKTRPTHTGAIERGVYVSHDGGPRLRTSVIKIPNDHGRAVHPTQKPLDLLEPLIRYSVPVGGIVVDPFTGSNSTGVTAERCGRRWVACEINPECAAMQDARSAQQGLELT